MVFIRKMITNDGNIAYALAHTHKHRLGNAFDQVDSTPIVNDSLAGLWILRNHPCFYSYPEKEKSKLADLIGFDIKCSEVDKFYGFPLSERDFYRKLADPGLVIPDITNEFTKGILTDVAKATREKVLHKGRLLSEIKRAQEIIEEYKLGVNIEKLREIFADSHAYATFIIGYCFPKLGEAERLIEEKFDWHKRLKEPKAHIESLISKPIS